MTKVQALWHLKGREIHFSAGRDWDRQLLMRDMYNRVLNDEITDYEGLDNFGLDYDPKPISCWYEYIY